MAGGHCALESRQGLSTGLDSHAPGYLCLLPATAAVKIGTVEDVGYAVVAAWSAEMVAFGQMMNDMAAVRASAPEKVCSDPKIDLVACTYSSARHHHGLAEGDTNYRSSAARRYVSRLALEAVLHAVEEGNAVIPLPLSAAGEILGRDCR